MLTNWYYMHNYTHIHAHKQPDIKGFLFRGAQNMDNEIFLIFHDNCLSILRIRESKQLQISKITNIQKVYIGM